MSDIRWTQQMKRHAVIIALKVQHNNTDTAFFLKVAQSFKNFDQDQKINCRNGRWLGRDPKKVPIAKHTKFPAIVRILRVISKKEDVMPPPIPLSLKRQRTQLKTIDLSTSFCTTSKVQDNPSMDVCQSS